MIAIHLCVKYPFNRDGFTGGEGAGGGGAQPSPGQRGYSNLSNNMMISKL